MNDIFDEVNEGLREDKTRALWRNWGPFVMGGAALVIAGVGALEYLQWSRSERIEKQARVYAEAIELVQKGDVAGAKPKLEVLAKASGGYAALSNLKLAEITQSDPARATDPAALAANESLLTAATQKGEGAIGDIALLKLAYLKADTIDVAELKTLVQPLMKRGGGVAVLARELLAAKAFAVGDIKTAKADYQALSLDIDAPPGVAQRAQQSLAMITAREAQMGGGPALATPAPATETPATPTQTAPAPQAPATQAKP